MTSRIVNLNDFPMKNSKISTARNDYWVIWASLLRTTHLAMATRQGVRVWTHTRPPPLNVRIQPLVGQLSLENPTANSFCLSSNDVTGT